MNENNAVSRLIMLAVELETMFLEQLCSLVPAEVSSISEPNEPIEFKSATSYFCIKDLRINRVWKEGFESTKPLEARKLDKVQAQSLSIVHFDPNNIERRMGFRWAVQEADETDANEPDVNAVDEGVGDASVSAQAEGQ